MEEGESKQERALEPGESNGSGQMISYSAERIIGNGSFGVVFQAMSVETGEVVAIKKVLQDKRFKNRELTIMRLLAKHPHTNIVLLKHCFYSNGGRADELYLNLVLEFVPETVWSVARQYQKNKMTLPQLFVKLYMYQLLRALAQIHALGICHRDIKPQNLLLDPETHTLKLCDFGSAKVLVAGEPNVSYICSRYYRAPELIFGATHYTTAIDIWSAGCVTGELLLGQPIFPGESGVDQLVEIIKVLGTPSKEEIKAMNSNYSEFKFPQIKAHPWTQVFRSHTPQEAIDYVSSLLTYDPSQRMRPLASCEHSFFDMLRDPNIRLPNGRALPPLFNWTPMELDVAEELCGRLTPPHAAAAHAASAAAGAADAAGEASDMDAAGASAEAGSATGDAGAEPPEGGSAATAADPAVDAAADAATLRDRGLDPEGQSTLPQIVPEVIETGNST